MKYLAILLILVSNIALSQEMPSYLKDGVITVTLTNGKTYKFSSNEWKVVPRNDKTKVPVPVTNTEEDDSLVATTDTQDQSQPDQKMNRVRLMGGVAPSGLTTSTQGTTVTVSNANQAVGGVGYDRMLNDKWSVNGTALTNRTYTLGVGLDF